MIYRYQYCGTNKFDFGIPSPRGMMMMTMMMQEVDAGGGCSGWVQGLDAGGGCRRRMQGVDAEVSKRLHYLGETPRACGGNRNPTNRPHNRSVAGTVPPKRISGVRSVLGRRLGPQVAAGKE